MSTKKNKVVDEVLDGVLGDTPYLTTSDLYSADFRTRFRGFDKTQVASFLERAADSFETLQRQVVDLRKTVEEQKEEIAAYRDLEKSLSEALASAQKMSENTIEQARREADLIRQEAEQLLESARKRASTMPEEIRDELSHLRAARKRLKADLRAVLDIHSALLRGDNDSQLDMLEFLPADGAAYLDSNESGEEPADVAIIEPDGEDAGTGTKENS